MSYYEDTFKAIADSFEDYAEVVYKLAVLRALNREKFDEFWKYYEEYQEKKRKEYLEKNGRWMK